MRRGAFSMSTESSYRFRSLQFIGGYICLYLWIYPGGSKKADMVLGGTRLLEQYLGNLTTPSAKESQSLFDEGVDGL